MRTAASAGGTESELRKLLRVIMSFKNVDWRLILAKAVVVRYEPVRSSPDAENPHCIYIRRSDAKNFPQMSS